MLSHRTVDINNTYFGFRENKMCYHIKDLTIKESDSIPLILTRDNPIMTQTLYCYKNSTAEANAVSHGCAYHLIDGDSLLWNVEVDLSNADVNADGIVNLKDAVLPHCYLAGWEVTLR